jgi:hypothetical protein
MPPDSRTLSSGSLRKFRIVLGLFMLGLVLSGLTAFPLERELGLICSVRGLEHAHPHDAVHSLDRWLLTIRDGLDDTYAKYPWLAYGTDWLAFAHIVLVVFFVGPMLDPVRNIWVLRAGLVACALVLPLALICGPIRHIPFEWRMIDCSFGIFGSIPLLYCLRLAKTLSYHRSLQNQPEMSDSKPGTLR